MEESLSFRPARPEDVEAAVPYIYSSGPAAFDYVFSHRTRLNAQEFLRNVFDQRAGEFGHLHHTVAELDGEVVATAAGWTEGMLRGFAVTAMRQILTEFGLVGGLGVIRRGLKLEHQLSPPKGSEFYIGHVGVRPDLRGHGIGGKLMQHMLAKGRAQGWKCATLDVSTENPGAQALYERLGFEVCAELPSKLENSTARVPSHRKMIVRL